MINKKDISLLSISIALMSSSYGHENESLDLSILSGLISEDDLNAYLVQGGVAGTYPVNIYLNDKRTSEISVEFINIDRNKKLLPCLSDKLLANMRVKTKDLPFTLEGQCVDIGKIPYASYNFNLSKHKLNIYLPGIYIDKSKYNTAMWDNGIPSLISTYYYSESKYYDKKGNNDSDSSFLSLDNKITLGPWRIINNITYNNLDKWKSNDLYLFRDIIALKSYFKAGQIYSSSANHNSSIPLTGINLINHNYMEDGTSFRQSPNIKGVAKSNAVVSVYQNDSLIYEKSVSAGPFILEDVQPLSNSDDLTVVITENNGSKQTFTVPYSISSSFLAEGVHKYSFNIGKYREKEVKYKPYIVQASFSYGLPNYTTLLTNTTLFDKYQALSVGLGFNFGNLGNLTLKNQKIRYTEKKDNKDSYNFDVDYSKEFSKHNLRFNIYYDKFDSNYKSPTDYIRQYNSNFWENDYDYTVGVSVNKGFSSFGTLSLSILKNSTIKNNDGTLNTYINYNNSFWGVSTSIYYSNVKSEYGDDNLIGLNLSIPLYKNISSSISHYENINEKTNSSNINIGYYNNNFSLSATESLIKGNHDSSSLNVNYDHSLGSMNAGISESDTYHQLTYGLNGSIAIHSSGITLGKSIHNGTAALIDTHGSSNIEINNKVKTDYFGYALIPNISEYYENEFQVNTYSIPNNVEFDITRASVVPTAGALTKIEFKSIIGHKMILKILTENDAIIPFGTTIHNHSYDKFEHNINNLIGDDNLAVLSGMHSKKGYLTLSWLIENKNMDCKIPYDLDDLSQNSSGFYSLEAKCNEKN
ncbi:putative outer membrane protein [Photobacterium sp. SKA34]|uniref:fimbria/pilus outer membrane usher protein n=1 Tax=Photobacterium sp. SKA34 TaxID=121723 RepID=UPI00006B414C|nr:fimbria/pilus outer membrane usher protein [Photobacterium sp. SKA34]EAR57720.1 putative outer membrane protein [Photobacterium sp. SKA34]